ncbi:MAG: biotin--[Solobacterium sp.]|nr:biotin--[acetyl-CoA-carboxylase] ligase [Solobacterium sp.]MBQ1382343.1 biotin--[acetyl-CoA-carboxylase] ligase [Solobacterium sp.]
MKHLSESEIRRGISSLDLPVTVLDTVDSTNTLARELLHQGAQPPFLILAETQTAGRGRQGHSFFSPQSGLYYSLTLPGDERTAVSDATLAAAVSLQQSIASCAGISCGIKWVNDLYLEERKVAGILCESPRLADGTVPGIIIGIGVNIAQKEFPEDLRGKAGSLQCPDLDRNILAADLTERLLYWCTPGRHKDLLEQYRRHCFILGRTVSFVRDGITITGTAAGINDSGNLIVDAGETCILNSGEISLRSW